MKRKNVKKFIVLLLAGALFLGKADIWSVQAAEVTEQDSKAGAESADEEESVTVSADMEDVGDPDSEGAGDVDETVVENSSSITTYSLTLEYDDYYSLSDFEEADLTGYIVTGISTESVSSRKVSQGQVTSEIDDAVVEQDSTGRLVASGVGTATVTLYNESENSDIILNITVEPATLTLMFVAGQSNAEGLSSAATGNHPEDSVMCEDGEVYSTYAPSNSSRGERITGISGISACTADNAEDFIAGSLTDSISISGSELEYPINSLTESGSGKTGMDSALAYQWNAMTGDKVWVINAAWSGSSIKKWISGASYYERALVIYQYALSTAEAEMTAGHYVAGDTFLYWLQGESDKTMTASSYMSYFSDMKEGFDDSDLGIDYYGIIEVRASTGSYTDETDLYMTGPRVAQYLMGNSSDYSNVYVVSNANEQWVSDSTVKSYFKAKYGSTLTYPLRSNTTLSGIPTTVSKVHADIHYAQVGHNENGLTAAETMYYIVNRGSASSTVSWYDEEGTVLSSGATCTLVAGNTYTYVPVASKLYLSKQISVSAVGSGIAYKKSTGVLSVTGTGSGTLTAGLAGSSCKLTLSLKQISTPTLKSATASASGTTVSWSEVTGAAGYAVYRKASGGSWSMIATTTSASYTDTTSLKNGSTYYYTVRAYSGSESTALSNKYSSLYWSSYDSTGVKCVYTSTPKLNSPTNTASGIKVSWGSVSGVAGYAVYRKTSGGNWSMIATTTSAAYTDTSASVGTTYYYTVRAYKGTLSTANSNKYSAVYWSGYSSAGVSGIFIKTPTLKTATASATGTTVNWSAVSGASGYAVYRKVSGGSWSMIASTTSTSYTDKSSLSAGKTYYYTVRAYRGSASTATSNKYLSAYWSYYNTTGSKSVYLKTPTLKSASHTSSGTKVSWSSVTGASGYAVYRKASGGSWSMIGTTTSTSYTDKSKLSSSTTYYYTVRAYTGTKSTALSNKYNAAYWSGYNSTGIK